MVLRGGSLAVALKLQEAADDLTAGDVRTRLSDAINDQHRGTGNWAYYVDHVGDGESGDVIYSCDSDLCRAMYSISGGGEGVATKCAIDFDHCESVVPRTIYEMEADEADGMAAMAEAFRRDQLYTELPIYERYVSKDERAKASADDFAGKGKSFPILHSADVMAAVRSMGRAGADNHSAAKLKARIISIAKRKGWEKSLPKSWRSETPSDQPGKESAASVKQSIGAAAPHGLKLQESAAALEPILLVLSESARPSIPIKLIAPGDGSSAYYPAEVLKRDGPKVFRAGTHVYANHPTAAEEAARPEGDVANLAGVLLRDAEWRDSHVTAKGDMGPGLYSEVKPFSDHSNLFTEKGEFLGMSIRAGGNAESGKKSASGKPILREFTYADSVDVVTKAGAGGMILTEAACAATEAARPAAIQLTGEQADMDAAEFKKLQESNAFLLKRALRGDAREEAERILKGVTLHESAKAEVVSNVLRDVPEKDGALDVVKFTEAVNAEAKRIGELAAAIAGSGRVVGLGSSAPVVAIDAKEAERQTADRKRLRESAIRAYRDIGMPQAAAEAAADRDYSEVA